MAKSLEQMANDLADRDAIRELPQRYCDCVWRGDPEGVASLFAEDGSFTVVAQNRENTTSGRSNLVKSFAEGLKSLTPRPYIHNHVIDLKGGGRASGRCYVEIRDASNKMAWLGTGFYEDEYVKSGEQWMFHSRRFHQTHMEHRQTAAVAQH